MRDPSAVRVIALCSCVLGTFFLAKSISTRSPKYMLHELLSFKVNRIKFFRKYVTQKLEVVVGFVCLLAGFGLMIYLEIQALRDQQDSGAMHGFANWWLVIGLTLAAMLIIAALLNRVCAFFSGKIFVELMRFMMEPHGFQRQNDKSLVLELGRLMKVKRQDSDTIESYGARIRQRMGVAVPETGAEDSGPVEY